ncbi:MAG: hypothetical protein N3H84_05365 [Candidatus Caldarchaeum sp.]|nr:hypothetical protein [Candidatus Caldarchaeum sp.]
MSRKPSLGLSGLVAAILLIAIVVAAAVVVSGVFFNLAGIAGRRPTAIIDQIKLVATPAGAGTWTIVVKNTGDVPITALAVTYPAATCNPAITFQYGTAAVSSTNPVPPGATATGTASIATGCSLGTTYRVTVQVTFADNSRQDLSTAATASIA